MAVGSIPNCTLKNDMVHKNVSCIIYSLLAICRCHIVFCMVELESTKNLIALSIYKAGQSRFISLDLSRECEFEIN